MAHHWRWGDACQISKQYHIYRDSNWISVRIGLTPVWARSRPMRDVTFVTPSLIGLDFAQPQIENGCRFSWTYWYEIAFMVSCACVWSWLSEFFGAWLGTEMRLGGIKAIDCENDRRFIMCKAGLRRIWCWYRPLHSLNPVGNRSPTVGTVQVDCEKV